MSDLDLGEFIGLIILPLLIFLARVADVSLGTIRIIFISKGFKTLSAVVSFIEMIIWLLAISQIFQHLTNVLYYLAYAGGFAVGTFVGMYVEGRLLLGNQVVRIITRTNADNLIKALKGRGYDITTFDAVGQGETPVKVILTVIDRHDLKPVIKLVNKYNPKAFYSVEDVKYASERILIRTKVKRKNALRMRRKDK